MKTQKSFGTAEFAAMTEKQQIAYQESLIHYNDMKNIIDMAVEEAVEKAVEIAVEDTRVEIAEKAILEGFDNKITSLTVKKVEKIRQKSLEKIDIIVKEDTANGHIKSIENMIKLGFSVKLLLRNRL